MKTILVLAAMLFFAAGVWLVVKKNKAVTKINGLEIDRTEDIKGLGYSGQRKVAVSDGSGAYVAYRKKFAGKSEIFVAKVDASKGGGAVSGTDKPIAVVGGGVDQRVPSILVDSRKVVHVVWYGSDSDKQVNDRQIKYSHSGDGGRTWSAWKNISTVDGYSGEDFWQEHPFITEGSSGVLLAVWEGKDAANRNQQIKISRSSDGGENWSAWKNVRETPDKTQSRPTMVRDKQGRLHLFAYSSDSGGKAQIVRAWSDDNGESWSEWETVSDPASDSRHISAATEADGGVILAWRALDSAGHSQIVFRSFTGGSWSEIKPVHPSQNNQFFPSVSAGDNGNTYIAWMESANPSGLPAEDPNDGTVYLSQIAPDQASEPRVIGSGAKNLYPNLPESFGKGGLPLVYESGSDFSQKFSIIFGINQF